MIEKKPNKNINSVKNEQNTKWTPEQQEAITLRNSNILVAAAAGSGKTAVLVERVKQLLLAGETRIDRILVVTFTNAAASEMKEKIVEALREEIRANPDNSDMLRSQLGQIYKANISTFHSFAIEIIRRYFHVIDIEPGFRVCDEAQEKLFKEKAIDTLFTEKLAEGSESFIHFLDCYSKTKSFTNIKAELIACYDKLRTVPEPFFKLESAVNSLNNDKEAFLSSKAFELMKEDIKGMLNSANNSTEALALFLEDYEIPIISTKLDTDFAQIKDLVLSIEVDDFEVFTKKLESFSAITLRPTKDEKPIYESIKDLVTFLRSGYKDNINNIKKLYCYQSLDAFIDDMKLTYPMAKELYSLLVRFDELYKEAKAEKHLIDFSDIEHYALEILKDESVARQYRDKFQYIFVDEYQDSNIIQETLISRIAREDNRFMVGDVKQSIYKFRLAEPEIFEEKYNSYKSGKLASSKAIDLNKNFRSKQNIIDTVNDQFESLIDGYDDSTALHRGVSYEGELDYATELHIVETAPAIDGPKYNDQEENKSDFSSGNQDTPTESLEGDAGSLEDDEDNIEALKATELEALTAVKLIKASAGKDKIFDTKKNIERTLEYRDIVILMRAVKNTADVYKKIFAEEGIPLFSEDSEGYFNTLEIEVFLNLLKVIDNKRQDIPLISVLYSPIFGFSASELADIRLAKKGRGVPFYEAFLESTKTNEKTQKVLERINSWKERARLTPLPDFIWQLMLETGFFVYAGALPKGEQRQANLRALVDKAGVFAENDSGIYGFLIYADMLKEKKVDIGQISVAGESENVVRIMTIHKSKGLDFPMVIVGGMGKRFNKRQDTRNMTYHKDIGLGMMVALPKQNIKKKSLMTQIIERRIIQEALEEEIRVLYVAYTRAIDRLVLLGTVKDWEKERAKFELFDSAKAFSAGTYLDCAVPILRRNVDIKIHRQAELVINEAKDEKNLEKLKQILKEAEDIIPDDETIRKLSYIYPYEEAQGQKSKYTVTELNCEEIKKNINIEIPDELVTSINVTGTVLSAAERGNIYHLMLEQADFTKLESLSQSSLLASLVEKELITKEEAGQITKPLVDRFLGSYLAKRMSEAAKKGRLWREVPFTLKRAQNGKQVLVQGIIDCFFAEEREDGGLDYILVDYKSNYVKPGDSEAIEHIKNTYREQIEIYSEALAKIKHIQVAERYLYLLAINEAISI